MINVRGSAFQIISRQAPRLESAMHPIDGISCGPEAAIAAALRQGRAIGVAIGLFCGLVPTGCGGPRSFDDPIAAMIDPRLTVGEQQAAMEQARREQPDDPRRIAQLKEIISGATHAVAYRAQAWRQLEEHNADEARAVLEYRLPTHPSWGFVEWACELIAERGWVEMTPALVRSLYRPSPSFTDELRPERLALMRLHDNRDIREIVFEVVADPPRNVVHAHWRPAAWELLNRLGESDPWQDRLALLTDDDPMIRDLRLGYVELGVIARTREEVLRLQHLRRDEQQAWWQRCSEIVAMLSPEQKRGLRLRHLPVLMRVQEFHAHWLSLSAEELLSALEAGLVGRAHFHPDAIMSARTLNTGPQSLREWGHRLSWPDLLTVRLADTMVFEPALAGHLFTQAQRDREDKSTEYGGVIDYAEGQPRATLYPPLHRSHDKKYYAPASMIEAGHTAPFHYHFHVQEVRNTEFAGPGGGDLEYAAAMAVNALVFTSVGEGRLNADFYTEDGIVIDLGTIVLAK